MAELTIAANSRFQVLDLPIRAPGKCAVCGSSNSEDRKYVDFGFTLDVYGVVYFCTFCVTEVAALLGLAPEENFRLAVSSLEREVSEGDDRYVKTKVELDAARILLRNCRCNDDDSGYSNLVSGEIIPEGESEDAGDPERNDEPSSIEGSDDFPEPPSDQFSSEPKRTRRKSASSE